MGKGIAEKKEPAAGNKEAGDELLQPNALKLAWLAETADGIRDKHLLLVMDNEKKLQLRETMKDGDLPVAAVKGATPIQVKTPPLRPDRVPVVDVTLQAGIGSPRPLPPIPGEGWTWDALFWTESAVEKFLYPYYQTQRLFSDVEMKQLKDKFNNKRAVAIAHRAPSNSEVIPAETVAIGFLAENERTITWTFLSDLLKGQPR